MHGPFTSPDKKIPQSIQWGGDKILVICASDAKPVQSCVYLPFHLHSALLNLINRHTRRDAQQLQSWEKYLDFFKIYQKNPFPPLQLCSVVTSTVHHNYQHRIGGKGGSLSNNIHIDFTLNILSISRTLKFNSSFSVAQIYYFQDCGLQLNWQSAAPESQGGPLVRVQADDIDGLQMYFFATAPGLGPCSLKFVYTSFFNYYRN